MIRHVLVLADYQALICLQFEPELPFIRVFENCGPTTFIVILYKYVCLEITYVKGM